MDVKIKVSDEIMSYLQREAVPRQISLDAVISARFVSMPTKNNLSDR